MSDIHPGRRPWILAVVCVLVAGHAPGAQDRAVQTPLGQPERIRVRVDLVTTSATVRDGRGRFLADLKPDEFELYEDGVRQTLVTFSLSHGGRVLDVARPTEGTREGLVLPPSRPPNDASGRIFLIFIDDAHLEPSQTPRVRELFNRITKRLIHTGDLFAHHLDRPLVHRGGPDLRPEAARAGGQQDHGQRPFAARRARPGRRQRRPVGGAASSARGLQHGVRPD